MTQHAEGSQASQGPSGSHVAQVKEVSPTQAWEMLQNEQAVLVDVRTEQELPDDGQPDLSQTGGEFFNIPWRLAPEFRANPFFMQSLKEKVSPQSVLLFLCRSGGRSYEAAQAAMAEGYAQSYNVIGGMEAEEGWKASGLAWRTT